MKTLINRYYYSLAELAEATGPFTTVTSFPAMLKRVYDEVPTGTPTQIEQDLFTKYLWPEFYESPIFYFDVEQKPWEEEEEPELEDVQEAAQPLIGRLYRWYTESADRYSYLLTQLESIKATLLGPVKVVSVASGSYSGTVSGSGTNTGTVAVQSTTGESSNTHATGTVTGSGTNTGTVQVSDSTNSTTTVSSTNTRKESDTPQDGIQSLLDGYVSKAAQETGGSTTTLAGSNTSTTTNNLANSNTSSTDSTTAVTASGTVASTTTNNLANSNNSTNSGNSSDNSTVSNDFNTPIERFREIQEKLRNLYADWANEFSKFVLHSAE